MASPKIRVAVLYGGKSAEHEVSLKSATNVIQYLDTSRFEVVPIGIDKRGNWFLGQDVFEKSLAFNEVPALKEGSQTWFAPEWIGNPSERRELKALASHPVNAPLFDVIFPVVHGTLCEDGTLQGLLEMTGIPYVGCGVLSSAIGMDKDVSKRLASLAGISVPPYQVIKQAAWLADPDFYVENIYQQLGLPLFSKPANTGSSIGVHKIKEKSEIAAAISEAFKFDTKVVVEKGLNIIELEVAVLESLEPNKDPIVSEVGEVKPNHEFYSYDAKYIDENGADLCIPAPISEDIKKEARTLAKKIFNTLECEGMARVDLFLTKDTHQLYFNEINTIPGFTQISMYPKLMQASGLSYSALLTHLVELAIKRHQQKSRLVRNYA